MTNRARIKLLFAVAVLITCASLAAFQAAQKAPDASSDPLIAGFQKTTVASVADAVDAVVGERGFMNFDMRPYSGTKFVGRARTSLVRPAPPDKATPALAVKHSVEMIEEANPGDVGVIVMENGLNVAAIGGLMATAAKARGMAGMVLDGGVRDVPELRALNLPVFARSVTPATAVGRYASVAKDIAVECAGVTVKPGDIIVAGEDGVVRVPRERAQEVLKAAQEIDDRETKMVPYIQKFRSLKKAIEVFNRI
ncbi:MAG: RraA family protein [Bryobacteraceae bacterium]|nr:RraA family protein [Bryobacterales bacterium]NUN00386.1 RraA family protein [Bryobacteraceae bacterium]